MFNPGSTITGMESKGEEAEKRHGHPEFYKLLGKIAQLHSDKNYDYAKGGNPLGNFERVARFLKEYPSLDLSNPAIIAIIYSLKQLDAVLWMYSEGHESKTGEGITARLLDDAVYKLIAVVIEGEKARKVEYETETDKFRGGVVIKDGIVDKTGPDAVTIPPECKIEPCRGIRGNRNRVTPVLKVEAGSYWVECGCGITGKKELNVIAAINTWNKGTRFNRNGEPLEPTLPW